ncbi:MAG: rhodanese-like domain-containing protein [Peptostreptococcaceae bacterium]|nr:rhodanese-like domain-containing protein [Peptostreptococcaceae bacterium]
MKKKFVAGAATVLSVMLLLAGCSKAPDGSKNEGTTTPPAQTETDAEKVEAVEVRKVFVTPQWVKSVLDGQQEESKKFVVAEAGWGSAADSPDYMNGHIPGAIHVDTSSIEGEPIWNLKTPEEVEKALLDAGITTDTTVILYGPDPAGVARVAHAYLWAGVKNVKVLNGGLNAWKNAGFELEKEANEPTPVTEFGVKVPAHPEYVLSLEETKKNLESNDNFKLVSIRSYEEFVGNTSGYNYIDKAGEPKGAVWGKAGSDAYHMEDYTHEDGTYITMEEMQTLWKDLDFTTENELSFYCGTGWRATIPFLIMYENGFDDISIYDGGWNEWQMHNDLPVQIGDPKGEVQYLTVGELSNDKKPK